MEGFSRGLNARERALLGPGGEIPGYQAATHHGLEEYHPSGAQTARGPEEGRSARERRRKYQDCISPRQQGHHTAPWPLDSSSLVFRSGHRQYASFSRGLRRKQKGILCAEAILFGGDGSSSEVPHSPTTTRKSTPTLLAKVKKAAVVTHSRPLPQSPMRRRLANGRYQVQTGHTGRG